MIHVVIVVVSGIGGASVTAQDTGIIDELHLQQQMKAVSDGYQEVGEFILKQETSRILQGKITDRVGESLSAIRDDLRTQPWCQGVYLVLIGRAGNPPVQVLIKAHYVGSGKSVAEVILRERAAIGVPDGDASPMPEESYYIVFELVGNQLFKSLVPYDIAQAQKERLREVGGRSIDLHAEILRVIWKRDELGIAQPKIATQAAQPLQPKSGGHAAREPIDRGNIHDAPKTVGGNSVSSQKGPTPGGGKPTPIGGTPTPEPPKKIIP